jgi:hypothetical protein
MKFMTKLESIIMNRTGCNRETANLVANDILYECEQSTTVADIKLEAADEIFEKIRKNCFPHYYAGMPVILRADIDRVEEDYREEMRINDGPKNT